MKIAHPKIQYSGVDNKKDLVVEKAMPFYKETLQDLIQRLLSNFESIGSMMMLISGYHLSSMPEAIMLKGKKFLLACYSKDEKFERIYASDDRETIVITRDYETSMQKVEYYDGDGNDLPKN